MDGQPNTPDAVAVTLVELALGDVSLERALGLILGTSLAGILSGATAYGAGTNVGLGAERLAQAVMSADPPAVVSGTGR